MCISKRLTPFHPLFHYLLFYLRFSISCPLVLLLSVLPCPVPVPFPVFELCFPQSSLHSTLIDISVQSFPRSTTLLVPGFFSRTPRVIPYSSDHSAPAKVYEALIEIFTWKILQFVAQPQDLEDERTLFLVYPCLYLGNEIRLPMLWIWNILPLNVRIQPHPYKASTG